MLTKRKRNYCLCFLLHFVLFFVISSTLFSEEIELNIIYTNDIHDHIRPGYMGVGGIPYVAGYVNQVREEKPNVLLVDAGDLTDKGDMVADLTNGELMYKIIEKMKYDVMVIGNHDYDKGIEQLCKLKELSPSVEFVATNYEEGLDRCYKPWVIEKIGDFSVGFVGVVKLGGEEKQVAKGAVPEIKKAIDTLKGQGCHFIVGLFHLGSNACEQVSREIPEISVYISGHTHELLKEPKICPDTNAIIVQAGSYANYAGHLKLIIDTQKQQIVKYENRIVELIHDSIKPDEEILNWVFAEEKKICPIASEFLIDNNKIIGTHQIAVLAVNAIKERANADIAFFHPRLLIRSTFPPTKLDYNAVYLTAGHRAKEIVEVTLSGRQIEQYLIDLIRNRWSRTEWTGMNAEYDRTFPPDKVSVKTDLVADKKYKVVLAKLEFNNRLLRSLKNNNENNIEEIENGLKQCDFTYFDAVSKYIEKIKESGLTLDKYIEKMKINWKEEQEENNYDAE